MAKYRKKPVVVEAEEFLDPQVMTKLSGAPHPGRIPEGVQVDHGDLQAVGPYYYIKTLEGPMLVRHRDWIITGVAGEKYPIHPDIFAATYELVEPAAPYTEPGDD